MEKCVADALRLEADRSRLMEQISELERRAEVAGVVDELKAKVSALQATNYNLSRQLQDMKAAKSSEKVIRSVLKFFFEKNCHSVVWRDSISRPISPQSKTNTTRPRRKGMIRIKCITLGALGIKI
jgi:hypothetical protein